MDIIKNLSLGVGLICVSFIIGACNNEAYNNEVSLDKPESVTKNLPNHESGNNKNQIDTRPFLERYQFEESLQLSYIEQVTDYRKIHVEDCQDVIGGILPHHSVARSFLSDYYRSVSENNEYDVIVLISPNHSSLGPRFQLGLKDYYTYEGVVNIDMEVSNRLLENENIEKADDEIMANEHGQLVHMPYIKTFFPDCQVISLIITETRDDSGLYEVTEALNMALMGKKVLYIASIDFSHYLSLDEALGKDLYTEELIESLDPRSMIGLGNDYLDSPSSYMLLLELLKVDEGVEVTISNHSNSALILKNKGLEETTSYFQLIFTK